MPINHGGLSMLGGLDNFFFTSHSTLAPLRKAFENHPFSRLSLPFLRAENGLDPSDTWEAAVRCSVPVVIPMLPVTDFDGTN